jgi:S-adenosylmethionine:tRNA ribosyltransferase-isomerase
VLEKRAEGEILLGFDECGDLLDKAIETVGQMPLPPYIAGKRAPDVRDRLDYQTLFAERRGAVAAPTASLHFTPRLIDGLTARGIDVARVTLHVGPGTFLPVKVEDTSAHRMHAEWGEVKPEIAERLNAARAAGGRIVAVGTTALRLLESAARSDGTIDGFMGETTLFITPGYTFKVVDLLLTNFHLPRSTLFMLVAAFSGLAIMKDAYRHAIEAGYRFYSYGDACLLYSGGD